jgi:hypothetical protein
MSAADEILSEIPIAQLAAQLGMDEASTERAVRQAVPALIGGMRANAEDPAGAASLQQAIGQHAGDPFAGLDLDQVDTDDGDKIVGHVFGDKREEVVNRLGADTAGGGIMGKLLPILAPLVMSWLAGKLSGAGGAGPADAGDGGIGGGLDDLIGGMTGGGGGIGDLLGGLLGGGDAGSSGGDDIGDLLGGLLGRGSKG